ncbi:MAG TPA: AI-2E family transporter [Ktedonobacteraceae bacterium]|nr:AI-2E family transporter [Ktedonobacteraceae bacterium]
MLSMPNQRQPSQHSNTTTAVWTRRLIILLTILAALALALVILWGASHITTSLLIFAVAALIAYAIVPLVKLFKRFIARPIAILVSYLIVLIFLGLILYLIISTMITQLSGLANNVSVLLTPTAKGGNSPLIGILLRLGLTNDQIQSIAQQLGSQLTSIAGSVAGGIVPIIQGIASGILNILLTLVISIYLLVDGSRLNEWLRTKTPLSQRGRVDTLFSVIQHVVGNYIRGQFTLCLVIGTIVGIGMAVLGLRPYAVLLGVLSFVTEFIPVLGTIICGSVAILLALTQGWLTAILVLAYFILVHIFEGYILAPRLVGKAVGLNPAISLLALSIGAELFGPWGAIFASPIAGLLQAFAVALWINYRKTHEEEFPQVEEEPAGEEAVGITLAPATPAIQPATESLPKE